MPIIYNTTTITKVMNNTTDISEVKYGATTVFTGLPTTATPTVGTPFCRNEQNDFGIYENYIRVNVTNNDTSAVTVYIDNISRGTLAAGATGTYQIAGRISVPYSYIINVYVQASGKNPSSVQNRSGSISFCLSN